MPHLTIELFNAHIETLNVKTWSKELASCQHVCYAVFNGARQEEQADDHYISTNSSISRLANQQVAE